MILSYNFFFGENFCEKKINSWNERISVLANRQIYDRVDIETGVLCGEGVTRLLMRGLKGLWGGEGEQHHYLILQGAHMWCPGNEPPYHSEKPPYHHPEIATASPSQLSDLLFACPIIYPSVSLTALVHVETSNTSVYRVFEKTGNPGYIRISWSRSSRYKLLQMTQISHPLLSKSKVTIFLDGSTTFF